MYDFIKNSDKPKCELNVKPLKTYHNIQETIETTAKDTGQEMLPWKVSEYVQRADVEECHSIKIVKNHRNTYTCCMYW